MRRSLIVVNSLLLVPTLVQAQGHGGGGGMGMSAHAMVAAPHMMAHASAPSVHVSSGARVAARGAVASRPRVVGSGPARIRRTRPSGTAFQRQFAEDSSDAPGLGFDEVHFAATHPRMRDRDRFRRGNGFGAFFPFFDGGFFLPSSPVSEEDFPEGQPEEVADNEPPQPPPHARTHFREQMEPPIASRDTVPAKTDEYVFVRRDGTLFFAVAYAWDNGTLRYVTAEGLRRSATRDSLDLDATQQFNEQRGMSFRVPA